MNQLSIAPIPATEIMSTSGELPAIRNGVDMAKLVGQPHLFGRIKMLRQGLMIEPVANLVMQPDGRVTGHGHPNEGRWSHYEHADVPREETFAFVSAGNGYIPSSTWTQSIGDMPIGHFCDEPEAVQASQRLCLLPQTVVPRSDDVVFLVASCLRRAERTLRSGGVAGAR